MAACLEGYYRDGWVAAADLPKTSSLPCKACATNMDAPQGGLHGMRSVDFDAIATYNSAGQRAEILVKGSPNACGAAVDPTAHKSAVHALMALSGHGTAGLGKQG